MTDSISKLDAREALDDIQRNTRFCKGHDGYNFYEVKIEPDTLTTITTLLEQAAK